MRCGCGFFICTRIPGPSDSSSTLRVGSSGSLGYLGIDGLYVLGIARRKSRADTGIHMSYYGYLVKSSQVKDEHAAPLNVCPPFAPPYNRENHQVEILG